MSAPCGHDSCSGQENYHLWGTHEGAEYVALRERAEAHRKEATDLTYSTEAILSHLAELVCNLALEVYRLKTGKE